MINSVEASKYFAKKYSNLHVIKIVDYDSNRFVVCAVENVEDNSNEMDPFYSIDKTTKNIVRFSPMEDIEKFSRLMFNKE